MQKQRIPPEEFNYYLKRAHFDEKALYAVFGYIIEVIKCFIAHRYGNNTFFSEVPYDIFTKIAIEHPPTRYIRYPVAYLCQITRNYINNMIKLKDNQTLELTENYSYEIENEKYIDFLDEYSDRAWRKLDDLTRKILYLGCCLNYKLKEIAQVLNMNYDNVRTKVCRAKKELKNTINKMKNEVKL